MRRARFPLLTLLAVSLPFQLAVSPRAALNPALRGGLDSIDAERIRTDLKFLADALLEGRGTGQRGGRLAALYLETRFRQIGLQPAASHGQYLQEVPLVGVETQPQSRLSIVA